MEYDTTFLPSSYTPSETFTDNTLIDFALSWTFVAKIVEDQYGE